MAELWSFPEIRYTKASAKCSVRRAIPSARKCWRSDPSLDQGNVVRFHGCAATVMPFRDKPDCLTFSNSPSRERLSMRKERQFRPA
jgi:hypothetical protein